MVEEFRALARVELNMDVKPLLDVGLITQRSALHWLIKKRYYQLLKENRQRSYRSIRLDLCLAYNVSESLIDKIIYK